MHTHAYIHAATRAATPIHFAACVHTLTTQPFAAAGGGGGGIVIASCTARPCNRSNKTLFRYVHYLHHEKSQPEAADLFFMHPLEALAVVAMPSLVLPYVVPLHWFIFEGWIVFSILIDVYGHLNFDAAPFHPFKISPYSHVRRLPWKKIFLQGRHHNAHHKLMRGNFALYFTFWDQFCQTRIED